MELSELSLVFSHIDENLELKFFRDAAGLKGFCEVQLVAGASSKPSADDLVTVFASHGVDTGCLESDQIQNIVQILRKDGAVALRRVAVGRAAQAGTDGQIVWLARYLELPPPTKRQVGVNTFFENVEAGREVARIHPPHSGRSGKDIFGDEILAPVSCPAELRIDNTLRREELPEYESIIAGTSGYLEFQDDRRLTVRQCLVVHSDVDATIGSIDFIGTVHIVGAVRENHSVTAVKGIKIDRGVQDGLIKSQADLAIGAAFVGSRSVRFTETSGQLYAEVNKKQSELVCGGHCKADLLQGLVAEVDGTLEVNREIRDCIVSVGEHLLIPHGQLMESAINTPWGVEIGTLGTEGGTPAIINLLADLSSTAEMRQVDAQVAQLLEAERLIKVHLGPLVEQPELLKKLESKHQAKVGEMLEKLTQVQSSLAHYQKQQQDLRSQALQEVQVNVLKAMYPGALVQCNGYSFSTSDVMNGPFTLRFNVNEGFSKEVLRKLPKLHKEEQ